MDKIEYNQTGGFPLDTNNLNFLQESLKIMQAFGNLAGNYTIIAGCLPIGDSSVGDGVVFINGEVYNFKGGNIGQNVIIVENATSGTFEDGSFKPIEIERYATFGTSTTNYPWQNFRGIFDLRYVTENMVSVDTYNDLVASINSRMGLLEAIVKPIIMQGTPLLWMRPLKDIPAGYVEYTGAPGKTFVARDSNDTDFATIGNEGGSKTYRLSESELPVISKDISVLEVGNPDWGGGGFSGGGNHWTWTKKTIYFGGGAAFNKMNPYRIVAYIIWKGL